MTEFIEAAVYCVGAAAVWCCLALVAVKVVWNLGLPYAMIRDKSHRGWSIFPLIEFVPLVLAMAISWLTNQDGLISPSKIAAWGGGAIVASYVHLAVVGLAYGTVLWVRKRNSIERSDK